jgi:UDP-glucose 4-epimerase
MEDQFDAYMGKKILITGGLGFIGSNLAIRLVDLGAQVVLVDSMIPDYGGNLFNIDPIRDRVKVNFSDIRDEHSMEFLVQGHDFIFNLAGQVSHIDSMTNPHADLDINVRSQLSILEACRKNNPEVRIIYASTRQIYGKPEYMPVDEKHPLHPTDINGINKMAGEWYHILYNSVYDMRTVVLRLTNSYGPRQLLKHARQGFIPWFVRQVVQGEEISIFGDGKQIRDLNYIDDVVSAMLMAGTAENAIGQIYNLGSEPITLVDLVELMIEVNGEGSYRLVPFPDAKKRIDIGSYYADFQKIKQQLGWEPKVSLREGLERTCAFYKEHGNHYW